MAVFARIDALDVASIQPMQHSSEWFGSSFHGCFDCVDGNYITIAPSQSHYCHNL